MCSWPYTGEKKQTDWRLNWIYFVGIMAIFAIEWISNYFTGFSRRWKIIRFCSITLLSLFVTGLLLFCVSSLLFCMLFPLLYGDDRLESQSSWYNSDFEERKLIYVGWYQILVVPNFRLFFFLFYFFVFHWIMCIL